MFQGLLDQSDGAIAQVGGDGADDTRDVYTAMERGAKVAPPRDHAVPWEADHPRTQSLAEIRAGSARMGKIDR